MTTGKAPAKGDIAAQPRSESVRPKVPERRRARRAAQTPHREANASALLLIVNELMQKTAAQSPAD
jgi:hypothetical protein